MDFIDGADLEDMVKANGRLPETDVLRWASQVMEALIYLQSSNRLSFTGYQTQEYPHQQIW